MFEFLTNHAQSANVILNTAMVLVWTVYLQIFMASHLRQARNVIHIDLGAAEGTQSRCLVTNLSSSAIYVQAIVADLRSNGRSFRTLITERDEINEGDVEDPLARTNRGTLQHGQTIDIGSLEDLVARARVRLDASWTSDDVDAVTITVVAVSGQIDRIVAAHKTFNAERLETGAAFSAQNLLTRQVRPRQTRAEFGKMLRDGPLE